jgi:16S rRNA (cytidine1402-2'-O)-methyltransferase
MSGTLYLVATPIGNLEDITLRALRVLRTVDVIAAEDTRRTARLLASFGIETPMVSCHQHNLRTRVPQLVARLQEGESIGLVSDAGTPVMSDPGLELVQACISEGIDVDALPGAHAGLTALVLSGFSTERVTLLAFPPSSGLNRTEWLQEVVSCTDTVVFFESPHRIQTLLTYLDQNMVDRPIAVARELTKLHQSLYRGNPRQIATEIGTPKGEFTVVVGPMTNIVRPADALSPADARLEFGELTKSGGLGRREAVVEVAQRHGLRPKAVYALLEASKELVK